MLSVTAIQRRRSSPRHRRYPTNPSYYPCPIPLPLVPLPLPSLHPYGLPQPLPLPLDYLSLPPPVFRMMSMPSYPRRLCAAAPVAGGSTRASARERRRTCSRV